LSEHQFISERYVTFI